MKRFKPQLEGDAYANLITAFAVIVAVEYASDTYDLWDIVLGVVSMVLGIAFSNNNSSTPDPKEDFWYSFITSGLIWLGFLTIFSWCAIRLMPYLPCSDFTEESFENGKFLVFLVGSYIYSESVLRKTKIEVVSKTGQS